MNGPRIALGLLIFTLCLACMTQVTFTGCAGAKSADADAEADDSLKMPFFAKERSEDLGEPGDWQPISEKVLTQVQDLVEPHGIEIIGIEQSESGASASKLMLGYRDGVGRSRQLLDGMYLQYSNFPRMSRYDVEVDGMDDWSAQIDWPNLDALGKSGYNYDYAQGRWDEMLDEIVKGTFVDSWEKYDSHPVKLDFGLDYRNQ